MMLEISNLNQAPESKSPVASDESVAYGKDSGTLSNNTINLLNTVPTFPTVNDYIKSSKSTLSLSLKTSNLNNSYIYQNPSNSHSNRSLSNKLPLNTIHKMALGRSRHPQNSNLIPGFPSKMPEIKKKATSSPPEEVRNLELKIQLVKKRLRSSSFNEREKEFDELESDILKDVNEVSKSIDKVLEERKEIQLQHRKWLEDRKKKIWETKKNTKIIKDSNLHFF